MCDCVEKVDEQLASRHTELTKAIVFGKPDKGLEQRIMIATSAKEPKVRGKRPVSMFPSFCPFCGEDWREPESVATRPSSSPSPLC